MEPSVLRGSLKTKIITWSFVPTVIILVAVAWFTFYSYQHVTEDLALNQDRQVTFFETSELSRVFVSNINPPLLNIIFSYTEFQNHPLEERAKILAADPLFKQVYDGGMVVLNNDGAVVFADPYRPDLVGANWNDRDYIQYARLQLGRAGMSNVIDDGFQGTQVIGIAVALVGAENQADGIVIALFRIEPHASSKLHQIFDTHVPVTGTFYILDANDRFLYHPDPGLTGTLYQGPAPWKTAGADLGEINYFHDVPQDRIISYGPFINSPSLWRVVREQSWQALLAPTLEYRRLLLLLLALGVVVPTLVVSIGVNRITRPIRDLIQAAQAVAGGQFDRRITAATGDEIEELAHQFNRMSARLQESYANLEQRVEDRTRELATLNAIANVTSQSLDLDEILSDALLKTLEKTVMEAGAAYKLNTANQTLVLMAYHGLPVEQVRELTHISLSDEPALAQVFGADIQEFQTASLPDSRLKSWLVDSGLHYVVIIPLQAYGQVRGYFCLGTYARRQITPEELVLLRSIGQQIGLAMENALLYAQAEETAVAAERNRLARELHDAVTQTLFSTSLIAEVLPELWRINPAEAARRTADLRQLTRGALAEMRTLLLELRPASLVEQNLGDLIRQLSEAASGRARLPVRITVQGVIDCPLEVKLVFYRIAQEALNNIVKHTHATLVKIDLRQDGSGLALAIQDNGEGFDSRQVKPESLGLSIIRERADSICARLVIDSGPDTGTLVSVYWNRPGEIIPPA